MPTKNYIAGSSFSPTELNDFQDEYVQSGMEPWLTIMNAKATIQNRSATTWRGTGDLAGYPPNTQAPSFDGDFLDPADFPMSHNGSLRTVQCRLGVNLLLSELPILDVISNICIKRVSANPTANNFFITYGSALGTFSPGNIPDILTTVTFFGSPFTFPSLGLYIFELLQSGTNIGLARAELEVFAQVRGV